MKQFYLVTALSLSLAACNQSGENLGSQLAQAIEESEKVNYETVSADKYSIAIPDFLKSMQDLSEDANIQYGNIYKEKYIIVLDENKVEIEEMFTELGEYDADKKPVDNYMNIQLNMIRETIAITSESKPLTKTINGMDTRVVEIEADVEGVPEPIKYWYAFYEGKEDFHMLMAWTLLSRKDKMSAEAIEMIQSLKEK